jgi:hypothetical protein
MHSAITLGKLQEFLASQRQGCAFYPFSQITRSGFHSYLARSSIEAG